MHATRRDISLMADVVEHERVSPSTPLSSYSTILIPFGPCIHNPARRGDRSHYYTTFQRISPWYRRIAPLPLGTRPKSNPPVGLCVHPVLCESCSAVASPSKSNQRLQRDSAPSIHPDSGLLLDGRPKTSVYLFCGCSGGPGRFFETRGFGKHPTRGDPPFPVGSLPRDTLCPLTHSSKTSETRGSRSSCTAPWDNPAPCVEPFQRFRSPVESVHDRRSDPALLAKDSLLPTHTQTGTISFSLACPAPLRNSYG